MVFRGKCEFDDNSVKMFEKKRYVTSSGTGSKKWSEKKKLSTRKKEKKLKKILRLKSKVSDKKGRFYKLLKEVYL